MVIISKMTFPVESNGDFGKKYSEINQNSPSYIQMRGPYVTSYIDTGGLILTIYELDRSKLADGLDYVRSEIEKLFGVPGFKHEIKVFAEMQDLQR